MRVTLSMRSKVEEGHLGSKPALARCRATGNGHRQRSKTRKKHECHVTNLASVNEDFKTKHGRQDHDCRIKAKQRLGLLISYAFPGDRSFLRQLRFVATA